MDYWIVICRIVDGGGGLIEMYEVFDVGDMCEFEGFCNVFYFGLVECDVFFVIGGIGVMFILLMIWVVEQCGIDWCVIYVGCGWEYMLFLDEVVVVVFGWVMVWVDDEYGCFVFVDELLVGVGLMMVVYVCGLFGMLEVVCVVCN